VTVLPLSIVTLQLRPYPTIDEMAVHLDGLAAQAAAVGSRIVLFPEMANAGLLSSDPSARTADPRAMGAIYDRVLTPFLEPFKARAADIARRHDLVVVGPSFWHSSGGVGTNSVFTFFPDGSVHRQDKIHPTRPEMAISTLGADSIGLFEVDGVKVAALICYDVQFPELARHLVDQGVKILLVPSLTGMRGYWRVRYGAHARATENQIYVCVSPIFGQLDIPESHPMVAHGGAYVTCPIDNRLGVENGLLADAPFDREGLLDVRLDLDLIDLSRERGEIRPLLDRRPDLYRSL